MSYQQRNQQQKPKYPFTDSSFANGIRGTKKANGREPVASFSPSGEVVYFNAAFLAEGDKQFGMKLTFKQMGRFIRILRRIATIEGDQPESVTMQFMYPKDGKWNHSGNAITVGRNAAGIVYFSPSNKQIETCHFKLTVEDDTRLTNHERVDIDAGENSRYEASRYADFLQARLDSWIKDAIDEGRIQSVTNNGNGGNNNYQAPQDNFQPSGGANGGGNNDFQDPDIPF